MWISGAGGGKGLKLFFFYCQDTGRANLGCVDFSDAPFFKIFVCGHLMEWIITIKGTSTVVVKVNLFLLSKTFYSILANHIQKFPFFAFNFPVLHCFE